MKHRFKGFRSFGMIFESSFDFQTSGQDNRGQIKNQKAKIKKDMKGIFTKGLLFFFLLLGVSNGLWAQSQVPHIGLTVRFEASTNMYEVYAKADSTLNNFYMGGGSQVSLVLPAAIPNVTLNITSVVGGPWSDNSQVYAPAAQSGSDFHSITTNGTMPAKSYTSGTEVLLFTFTTPSGMCDGGLRLFRNKVENGNPADPNSTASGMLGGDFLNYLGEVNTGNNYYKNNYNNTGITCGGHPPIITPFVTTTLPEDSTITICTLFSDVDALDSFTVVLCKAPFHGQATAVFGPSSGNDICVTYTPSANFSGMDSVCVSVCDQLGNCDSVMAVFNVTPVNDPPVAQNNTVTTAEDTPLSITLVVADVDGPSKNFTVLSTPKHGTVAISPSGIATYTPSLNYSGLDTFSYVVCDGGTPNLCDTAFVFLTVTPVNDPPTITNIGTTFTQSGTPVTSCTPFSDPDTGNTFTASLCASPSNGTATVAIVNNQVCVTYSPVTGFSGSTALCVSVCDQAGACDSTIFNISVTSDTVSISNACLACPAAISANVGFASCSATVPNLGQPTTTGNCAAASISNNATSNVFPLGQNIVTWTLTASNGSSATCTQIVTVKDNQAPQVTCPANLTFNTNNTSCSTIVPSLGSPGASDNCGAATVTNNHPSTSYPVGLTTVTWTASDANGNTKTCNQTVLVRDNVAPTITCPATLTATANGNGCSATLTSLGTPTTNDNCGVTSVSNDHPGTAYPLGATTVIWSVSDATGNTASCSQTIQISDGTAPSIVCPSPIIINPATGSCTATINNLGNPTASDNCGTPTITNNAVSQVFQSGNTIVIWTATDAGGLKTTCTQNVLVRDQQFPILNCPANLVVNANTAACFATIPSLGTPNATDNCTIASLTNNHSSTTYNAGVTTVIWTAVDAAGNSVTCAQSVTVQDTQAPLITCPANLTVNAALGTCTATINNIGNPISSDNCTSTTVTNNVTTSTFPSGSTTILWTAADAGGNKATCAQQITVIDNQKPTIACPVDVHVNTPNSSCEATVTGLGAPTSADNCSVVSVVNNQTTTLYSVGTATVIWTASDAAGNTATCSQSIIVSDGQNPTITCPDNLSVSASNGACTAVVPNLGAPVTADNCGVALTTNNHSNTTYTAGTTTVIWTVHDNGGNTATCTQTVTVSDNIAPTITCPNPMNVNAATTTCSATIANIGSPITADNCGLASTTNNTTSAIFAAGETIVVWTVSDNNGNTATCTQTITVTDNTAPTIACPTNITNVSIDTGSCMATVANLGAPTTTDNCDASSSITVTNNNGSSILFSAGTTTVLWTAMDANGNSASCAQTVSVTENEAPTIICPANIDVNADSGTCEVTILDLGTVATADNCGIDTLTNNAISSVFSAGLTTVLWTVSDLAGNTTTCVQTVTVNEIQAPLLFCPPNLTVSTDVASCFASSPPQSAPAASDNCGISTLTNNYSTTTLFPLGENVLSWTATDVNGNSTTCTFSLIVESLAPFALECPSPVVVNLAGTILSDSSNFLTSANPTAVGGIACAGVALFYEQPKSNDNCGAVSYSHTGPSSGATFGVGTEVVTFTAKNQFDNEVACTVEITVQSLPTVNLTVANNTVCPGSTVQITAPTIPNATYTWSGPGGNFPNKPILSIPNFGTNNEGYYDLSVTSNGCELMSEDLVQLNLDVRPFLLDDAISIVQAETEDTLFVLFNDQTLPMDYDLTVLNPIQGITNLNNGKFIFDESLVVGDYTFDYTICSTVCPDLCDTATARVEVLETVCGRIPNTISPNGDGINDEFVVPCLQYDAFPQNSLVIYNQWGDVVFKAAPYEYNKDKSFKGLYLNNAGEILPDGPYYYIFRPGPEHKPINGYIQIFR